jgi:hypothetical protein
VKLGGQLDYLAGTLDSDFAPTTQQREVGVVLAKETRDTHALLTALLNKELVDHNNLLKAKGLKAIDVNPTVP